jgi:hypothetical protein
VHRLAIATQDTIALLNLPEFVENGLGILQIVIVVRLTIPGRILLH